MTISFANPWVHIGVTMMVPLCVIFLWANEKLRNCRREIQNQGLLAALPSCFLACRWYFLFLLLAFGLSVGLVVGLHRLFIGINATDAGLTLDYPWPRSDVKLEWGDVKRAAVERQQFRFRYMFRLRIDADSSMYVSPWTKKAQIEQAHDIIKTHLEKRGEIRSREKRVVNTSTTQTVGLPLATP